MARPSFEDIKARVGISMVLARYYAQDDLCLPDGKVQLRLPCIICNYDGRSLSVHTGKNVFKCFHCGAQGNVLDLVCSLEEVELPQASDVIGQWFPQSKGKSSGKKRAAKTAPKPTSEKDEDSKKAKKPEKDPKTSNTPLGFELKGIDPTHERVIILGIKDPEGYGIGLYSGRGAMKDSVVCPIHSIESEIIGYCSFDEKKGRVTTSYPPSHQFAKNADLFNVHRAKDRTEKEGLYIVQHPYDAILLNQRGFNAVAFMDDLPGSVQLEQLYAFYEQESITFTYCYIDTDSAKKIGKTILALSDLPIVVMSLP